MRYGTFRSSPDASSVIPELPFLPREEHFQIRRHCTRRILRYWYFLPVGVLVIACTVVGNLAGMWLASHLLHGHGWTMIGGICGALLLIGPVLAWVGQRFDRRLYRHFMSEVRVRGLCPSCGYNLRATPRQCPECGWSPEPDAPGMADAKP